ncbi:hypothetical protein JOE11_005508, partial [Robbsia andropogonis]
MSATQADVFRLYSSMSGVQPAAATCRVSAERPLRPEAVWKRKNSSFMTDEASDGAICTKKASLSC